MIRTCVKCNEEFNDKDSHNKKGFINECGACACADVERYIGVMDAGSKSGSHINVFRKNLKTVSAVVKSQNRAGFNANLGLGSTSSTFGESHDV